MEIKITKRTLVYHPNNDMVCNWYYLVQGRIINDQKTRFRKFKFIVMFDADDLWEWNNKETISQADLREYTDELAYAQFTCYIANYDDVSEFYKLCSESIERYNKLIDSQNAPWW